MRKIKTILADDHRIFTEGLRTVLNKQDQFQFDILGIVHDGAELIRKIRRWPADLLILDMNMPSRDGLEVLEFIRRERIGVKVLALTMYDDQKIIKSAFKLGVNGYILKNRQVDELYVAVNEIISGNTYMGEGVSFANNGNKSAVPTFHANLFEEDRFIKKHHLTRRELEILRLITQALSNKEIAKELFISDQTVSVHRKNIMRKLGVSNTAGLIKMAYDYSLV